MIAGGTGFLGSPLAETYAEDGHDVRVLTRGLPPGEARHESGTGVPGISRVGWQPDGQAGPWAGLHFGRGRGDQPRRCLDRRKAMDAAAEGGAPRQPAARDPKPGRRDRAGAGRAAAVHQLQCGRLLRPVGRRSEDRSAPAGSDFLAHLCEDWEAEARKAARDGHPARDHPHRPRPREVRRRPGRR